MLAYYCCLDRPVIVSESTWYCRCYAEINHLYVCFPFEGLHHLYGQRYLLGREHKHTDFYLQCGFNVSTSVLVLRTGKVSTLSHNSCVDMIWDAITLRC